MFYVTSLLYELMKNEKKKNLKYMIQAKFKLKQLFL